MTHDGNGDDDNKAAEEAQKEALREEREKDPEAFDEKYGTNESQESGDPHKQ